MQNIDVLVTKLENLVDRLHDDSANYVAELEIYPVCDYAEKSPIDILNKALEGEVIIEKVAISNQQELIAGISAMLSYEGLGSSHPNRAYVGSAEHGEHLAELSSELKRLTSHASSIKEFWLKKGYPFYAVFWDLGFIITINSDAYVIAGMISD
ncbi:hypothetical protein [uncultured Paraglaciecola sp.]|uniref:hypothetical protein n=1 Tax=uncultured Paraglaciecola sp. TaxID=1765024 RepID=UPI002594EA24|nr:hypothetical protein [uncultured Paraglaciecola sp.]